MDVKVQMKWSVELDKWKFKICRVNFPSKQSNSERKARAPSAGTPVQIQSSNFSSKQSSQKFQWAKLYFFIVFVKMKDEKENVSFNKKRIKVSFVFLSLSFDFHHEILKM